MTPEAAHLGPEVGALGADVPGKVPGSGHLAVLRELAEQDTAGEAYDLAILQVNLYPPFLEFLTEHPYQGLPSLWLSNESE